MPSSTEEPHCRCDADDLRQRQSTGSRCGASRFIRSATPEIFRWVLASEQASLRRTPVSSKWHILPHGSRVKADIAGAAVKRLGVYLFDQRQNAPSWRAHRQPIGRCLDGVTWTVFPHPMALDKIVWASFWYGSCPSMPRTCASRTCRRARGHAGHAVTPGRLTRRGFDEPREPRLPCDFFPGEHAATGTGLGLVRSTRTAA